MNHDLAQKVLRTIKQRTNLLAIEDVMPGTNRLEARAPLHGVTLNVPGIVVYLSGYAIVRMDSADEGDNAKFMAYLDGEHGTVWDVAQRLLELIPVDTSNLFGYPTKRAVLAAFEQLAAGADQIDWSKIRS